MATCSSLCELPVLIQQTVSRPTENASVRNEFSGRSDTVVQAGSLSGTFNLNVPPRTAFPRPRQLPSAVRAFVNRRADLRRLDAALDDRNAAVVIAALSGAAGVGKTALAVQWAHSVRDRFPDGDLYINLRGYDAAIPVSAQQALEAFLRALDVRAARIPADIDEQAALYRSVLSERRVLVVLDNASSAEQVRPLLPGTRSCVVVVTSRNRLTGLVVREGADRMVLEALPPDDAVDLLREIVGAERVATDPEGALALARQCAYLPLALRIVADKATADPDVTLRRLADELASQQRRLDGFTVDDDLSEVRAVFSWSYQALPGADARLFRLLGAHPGPDIATAAAAALAQLSVADARRMLQNLADVHMLTQTGPDRFRLHDLLRAYAAERFEQEEPPVQARAASRRLLGWYFAAAYESYQVILPQGRLFSHVEFGQDTATIPVFDGLPDALKWCENEHANLMDAIAAAEALGFDDLVWKIAVSCMAFLERLSYWSDWIVSHERAVAATRRLGDKVAESFVTMLLGDAYWFRGRFDDALSTYRDAVAASRAARDRWTEGFALRGSALVHLGRSNFEQAVSFAERARTIFRTIGETRGEGMSLLTIGMGLRGTGQLDAALARYAEATEVFQRITNPWSGAMVRYQVGLVLAQRGGHTQALVEFAAARTVFTELGDHRHLGQVLRDTGDSRAALGQVAEARACWELGHEIFQGLDDPGAAQLAARIAALPG